MRKDYMTVSELSGMNEIEFVARHGAKFREQEARPNSAIQMTPARDEYLVISMAHRALTAAWEPVGPGQ